MKKVAICLRGAVSKECGSFDCPKDLYKDSPYVDYVKCKNSIIRYIVNANPNYEFDFFCHGWSYDLEDEIKKIYNPKIILFENNNDYIEEMLSKCQYERFSQLSQALSIKKSIELKEYYEYQNNDKYDIVISYRYDVLLWKPLILDKYNLTDDNIYVNAHGDSNGDFHFIMNNYVSNTFKNLYNSTDYGIVVSVHQWIKEYVTQHMRKNLIMDDIVPGVDQEAIRKINTIHPIYIEYIKSCEI